MREAPAQSSGSPPPANADGVEIGTSTVIGPRSRRPLKLEIVRRWDVIVNADNPGVWAFHCDILPHAESEHGMHCMVTAMIVQ